MFFGCCSHAVFSNLGLATTDMAMLGYRKQLSLESSIPPLSFPTTWLQLPFWHQQFLQKVQHWTCHAAPSPVNILFHQRLQHHKQERSMGDLCMSWWKILSYCGRSTARATTHSTGKSAQGRTLIQEAPVSFLSYVSLPSSTFLSPLWCPYLSLSFLFCPLSPSSSMFSYFPPDTASSLESLINLHLRELRMLAVSLLSQQQLQTTTGYIFKFKWMSCVKSSLRGIAFRKHLYLEKNINEITTRWVLLLLSVSKLIVL